MGLHRRELYYKQRKWSQSNEAGVHHLRSNKITTVISGRISINKTINRAELAGIAAALTNEHTYVATDSAGALWQIRNSILYPQRMKRHKGINMPNSKKPSYMTSSYLKTLSISARLKLMLAS
jgi:ribonuclease HI